MTEEITQQNENQRSSSDVSRFYRKKNVFITGAAGFLGKVILWKLIDSCTEIDKIYVLLRSKRGVTADQRLKSMFNTMPFSQWISTEKLDKVVCIEGDITHDGLGLSPANMDLLSNEVNIVIHGAACIKFNSPLKHNILYNFHGTEKMLKFCETVKSLEAFVYISTAFSNCQRGDITEMIYPLKTDFRTAIRKIDAYPGDSCDNYLAELLEGRPNTYTYSKALAEHLVFSYEGKFPISIVRPSIVSPSIEEPLPGWVDNVNTVAGICCLGSIGALRIMDFNYYGLANIVPVDYVASSVICSAYYTFKRSPSKAMIFNVTSGTLNRITWGKFWEMGREYALLTPTTRIIRPMVGIQKQFSANPVEMWIHRVMNELVFAFVVDTILYLLGYKTVMLKIKKKCDKSRDILRYFASREWLIKCDNVIKLADFLSESDKRLFKLDVRLIDWNETVKISWAGCRRFLLKDEPTEDSYKLGRFRQKLVAIAIED